MAAEALPRRWGRIWRGVGAFAFILLLVGAVVPPRPAAARHPDQERLARARERFGGRVKVGRLGPYVLYTDLRNPATLRHLDAVASRVELAYRARYGREPVGEPAEVIVLYAREKDYRAYQNQDRTLAALPASGHSGYGIVALFDGGRPEGQVAATLVHELTHLLNRRALGPYLPSWLDEGLADDLARSHTDESAALHQLARSLKADGLRPLPELLRLDWQGFMRDGGKLNYAQSSYWVGYLLDGEGGALAARFRLFLDAVARGGPPTAEALQETLGRPWEDLQAGFNGWVLSQRGAA